MNKKNSRNTHHINPNARYKGWAVQYNYIYDVTDDAGNPKNPDPLYFTKFDGSHIISFEDWLKWRNWFMNQRLAYGFKQCQAVYKAIKRGFNRTVADKYLPAIKKGIIDNKNKPKIAKYGLFLNAKHDGQDLQLNSSKDDIELKGKHMHSFIELQDGITYNVALEFFAPTEKNNLTPIWNRTEYARYLIHASTSAFDDFKYKYGEQDIFGSNIPKTRYNMAEHCVSSYFMLDKNSAKSKRKQLYEIDDIAYKYADNISAGIMTADYALNKLKLQFGSVPVDDFRTTFANDQKDYQKLIFEAQKLDGRNLKVVYINGRSHTSKSDLAESIAKASNSYHLFHPVGATGKKKTPDMASGWSGEPQLVLEEFAGYDESFKAINSLFDPDHVSETSSREHNKKMVVDKIYIANATDETKWVLDNLISTARADDDKLKVLILQAIRRLNLTPDELVHFDNSIKVAGFWPTFYKLVADLKPDNYNEPIREEDIAKQLFGTAFSDKSDTISGLAIQLVRRFLFNIQTFRPGIFQYSKDNPFYHEPVNEGDPIDQFTLNQRITKVLPLSAVDKFTDVVTNDNGETIYKLSPLFNVPSLPFDKNTDNGYFIKDTFPRTENEPAFHHIKYENYSFDADQYIKSCQDLFPYFGKYDNALDIVAGRTTATSQGEYQEAQKIVNKVNRQVKEEKNKVAAKNNQMQRVFNYNYALASCPLFSDDPAHDTIFLVNYFNADINRMITGFAIGLKHFKDKEEYREKGLKPVGIAIAKLLGFYQPEAKDYLDPKIILKELRDHAINGYGIQ